MTWRAVIDGFREGEVKGVGLWWMIEGESVGGEFRVGSVES